MEVLVAVAIAVGMMGIVVPILPGAVLVVGAICVWAALTGGGTAWAVFAVAVTFVAAGQVVKYLLPGRRLKASGVPSATLLAGFVLGVVGFFVIPVVGLFVGFVVGVYLAEVRRLGRQAAWPSTVAALRAVGLSILIELLFTFLATLAWVAGLFAT